MSEHNKSLALTIGKINIEITKPLRKLKTKKLKN